MHRGDRRSHRCARGEAVIDQNSGAPVEVERRPAIAVHPIARVDLGMKTGRGLREWPPELAEETRARLFDHLVRATSE